MMGIFIIPSQNEQFKVNQVNQSLAENINLERLTALHNNNVINQ